MSHCLAIVTGSFIYTCNQCLSPLSISVRVPVVFTIQLNRIKLTSYPYCFSETLFHFRCFDYFILFYLGGGGLLVCLVPNVTCVSRLFILDLPPPATFSPLVCSDVYLRQVDCLSPREEHHTVSEVEQVIQSSRI